MTALWTLQRIDFIYLLYQHAQESRLQGRPTPQPPMGRVVVLALKPREEPGDEVRKAPDGRFVQGAKENVAYRPKNPFYFPLLCG